MVMSRDEQRRWRALARQLRRDRRLAAETARFNAVSRWRRDLAAASAEAELPPMAWLPAVLGVCLGLILVVSGTLTSRGGLAMAGVAILTAILVLAGTALLLTGIADRRPGRGGEGRPLPGHGPPGDLPPG